MGDTMITPVLHKTTSLSRLHKAGVKRVLFVSTAEDIGGNEKDMGDGTE